MWRPRQHGVRRVLAAAWCVLALLGWHSAAMAVDAYMLDYNFGRSDYRDRYTLHLLTAALDASVLKYGPYEIRTSSLGMERDRLLQEMVKGDRVNLSAQITSPQWEESLIPIRVPVDKGLSGFRISLIDSRRQAQLSAVETLEQLKTLALGAGRQWSSTAVFLRAGFDVVPGNSTSGLHSMLGANRFLHFPRSIDEAIFEQKLYVQQFPALAIETSMTIYIPLPRYFFVAPNAPHLARRLDYGMHQLVADGRFDQIFHQFYDEMIAQVGLRKRRIFRLDNPFLSPKTPLANKAYWYDPLQ